MESLVIAHVETLRKQLVWGFYETDDGSPEYTQGNEKLHELHELVTAEECNGLVKVIKERITERDRLKVVNTELAILVSLVADLEPEPGLSAVALRHLQNLARDILAKTRETTP